MLLSMSSRQEEKERRKQERLRQEREAVAREKRRRVIQISAAALVSVAVIAGGVLAASAGDDSGGASPDATAGTGSVPLPPKRIDDLQAAIRSAGCKLRQFESEGQIHVPETTELKYKTNPATSGDHFAEAAQDGVYTPGNEPQVGNWVHSLEHGRILLQYRPGTAARRIGQLETLFNESYEGGPDGYHTLLLQNNSRMPFAVGAVAWTRYVTCDRFTDRTFDALREFREEYVDKAPEQVP